MEEKSNIPYEKLASDCKIVNSDDPKETITLIEKLTNTYSDSEIIHIYNYFFENTNSIEVLKFLLKKIDLYKDNSSRTILIDSLLMKEKMSKRFPDKDILTQIRVNITKVLANTKDSQAVYPLLYCLNSKDENYKIKLSCADALGKIGDKYAVLPLINVVEDEEEESIYVKESAVSALGMLGDSKAIESILSILESRKGFINKFTFLKERALEALNKIGFRNDRVFNALEKSLYDESPQVRINAIEVLMNSDDERAIELIKKMLFDNNIEVVQNAVIALFNILGDDILDEIINNSEFPDSAKTQAIHLKYSIDGDIDNE